MRNLRDDFLSRIFFSMDWLYQDGFFMAILYGGAPARVENRVRALPRSDRDLQLQRGYRDGKSNTDQHRSPRLADCFRARARAGNESGQTKALVASQDGCALRFYS